MLDPLFDQKDWDDWKVIFTRVGLQAGPVYTPEDAVERSAGASQRRHTTPPIREIWRCRQMIDTPIFIEGVEKRR